MLAKSKTKRHELLEFDKSMQSAFRALPKKVRVNQGFQALKQWKAKTKAPVDDFIVESGKGPNASQPNELAFQYLIAVILSVQSRDEITERLMKELIKEGISIDKYYKLKEQEIFDKIQGINFNKKKAYYIKEAVRRVKEEHDGKVPDTLEGLTKFPGVGYKVANLVLQKAYKKFEGVAVDVHVHRISNRLGWVETSTPNKTMEELNSLFTKDDYFTINYGLVSLGQTICKKTAPDCGGCPLQAYCEYGAGREGKEGGRGKRAVEKIEKVEIEIEKGLEKGLEKVEGVGAEEKVGSEAAESEEEIQGGARGLERILKGMAVKKGGPKKKVEKKDVIKEEPENEPRKKSTSAKRTVKKKIDEEIPQINKVFTEKKQVSRSVSRKNKPKIPEE